MNPIIYRMSLDMQTNLSQGTIEAKKGDNLYRLIITLTDNGKLYRISKSCYATFSAKKSDGNFLLNTCVIEGNNIIYEFTPQTTSCVGVVECEVVLYNEDCSQITSPRFTLVVDDVNYIGGESFNESNIYNDLVDQIFNPTSKKPQSGVAIHKIKPGEKTPEGGEIFNDYKNNQAIIENAHAEGQETLAGSTVFEILGVNTEYNTISLGNISGLAIGDVVSLFMQNQYDDYATVTDIIENPTESSGVITINQSIPEEFVEGNTNQLRIAAKPYAGTTAIGTGAHAEGWGTQALNKGSHAEGDRSVASGSWSHAEGRETYANYAAHAEGIQTKATGQGAHSEGNKTEAQGYSSHAEGGSCQAIGEFAHAQGASTKAKGSWSHAEGKGSIAAGAQSHAEGLYCSANGSASHAGGAYTNASVAYQTAIGKYNALDPDALFIVGNGTGQSARSNAFVVKANGSLLSGTDNKVNVPNGRAGGKNNIAGIKGYHFNSDKTVVNKDGSGNNVSVTLTLEDAKLSEKAINYYAVGDIVQFDGEAHLYNQFDIAENGITKDADGNTVITIKHIDDSYISDNHAVYGLISGGTDDIEDWIWVAEKSYGEPVLRHQGATADGIGNVAGGYGATSFGRDNNAIGDYSFAGGRKNIISALGATAFGRDNTVISEYSAAIGRGNTVSGTDSIALGRTNKATGDKSFAIGVSNEASGWVASASGADSIASGNASFVHGQALRATEPHQAVVGKFNEYASDTAKSSLFTVGNGAGNARSNAFTVHKDGHAELQTMGDNDNSVATKKYVDQELATFDFIKVVDELPAEGLPNKIYLVPSKTTTEQDLFDEYIWINKGTENAPEYAWEFIASKVVEVDLTNYATNDEVNAVKENVNTLTDSLNNLVAYGTTEPTSDIDAVLYVQYEG